MVPAGGVTRRDALMMLSFDQAVVGILIQQLLDAIVIQAGHDDGRMGRRCSLHVVLGVRGCQTQKLPMLAVIAAF